MKNGGSKRSRPRLSCRGRARAIVAVLAVATLAAGCSTTHRLGRIDDPGVRAQVDAVAAKGDSFLHVWPPPGMRRLLVGDRVTGVVPLGLVVEPKGGPQLLVPREQVQSLSRYDHAHGARNGAIGGGLAGFAIGLTLGILLSNVSAACSDDCGHSDTGPPIIEVAAVLGAIGALLGGGFGALAGH
jgi:hypothetical protein